jgi:CheY-like chemotaxis protein
VGTPGSNRALLVHQSPGREKSGLNFSQIPSRLSPFFRVYKTSREHRISTQLRSNLTWKINICACGGCQSLSTANNNDNNGRLLSRFRALIVEDHPGFRQVVCSMLGEIAELQIVGEAEDGLEAVHKAEELRPDLIVLDLELPKLNGMETARRIRKLSPNTRILMLSQESSPDVVETALRDGAKGYVVKMDAGSELLRAVKALLRGEQFLGARFSGLDFALA